MHEVGGYALTEISAIIGILTAAFSFVIWMFKRLVMDRLSWDMQNFKRSVDILAQTLQDNTKRLDKAERRLFKHDIKIENLEKEVAKDES